MSKVMLIILEYCILVSTPPKLHLDRYMADDREKVLSKVRTHCINEALAIQCPYPKEGCEWL